MDEQISILKELYDGLFENTVPVNIMREFFSNSEISYQGEDGHYRFENKAIVADETIRVSGTKSEFQRYFNGFGNNSNITDENCYNHLIKVIINKLSYLCFIENVEPWLYKAFKFKLESPIENDTRYCVVVQGSFGGHFRTTYEKEIMEELKNINIEDNLKFPNKFEI